MSATYEERVFRWGAWYGAAQREGWKVVGYEHQCGTANVVDFAYGYGGDDACCAGCRYEIADPDAQCKPLYQPEPGEPA